MSRPRRISAVLSGITVDRYARLAEEGVRLAGANARLRQYGIDAAARVSAGRAKESQMILSLGRPEYKSLRHAQWKEKIYTRARRQEDWDGFQWQKRHRRWLEYEQKQAEWLEFDPTIVPVSLDHLPAF